MIQKIKQKLAYIILEWAIHNRFHLSDSDNIFKSKKLFLIGKEKFVGNNEDHAIVFSVLEGDGSQPKYIEDVRY